MIWGAFQCETIAARQGLTSLMRQPDGDVPSPDAVEEQMRSAIERIRAKLAEPEGKPKPENLQPENGAEEPL